MSRKARQYIISSNTFYHVVSRGNNQQKIFRRVRDYKKFLKILTKTKKQHPFYFYSYNLLPNHYHLEIETRDIPISKIMHQINSSYVRYFRRQYGGSGHLFQERFFSGLINKESYLWEVSCYIDNNAVQAGLVKKPEDYRWSSYSIYYEKYYDGDLIDRDRFLQFGGEDTEKLRISYLRLVREKLKSKKEPPFLINKKMD